MYMRIVDRIICATLAAIMMTALFLPCEGAAEHQQSELWRSISYKHIPGVTVKEIEAIEALRDRGTVFVYGMAPSTEAFAHTFDVGSDEIGGYAVLFCDWLTGLFDMPFVPALYEWGELLAGLEAHTIDFTGELTATEERQRIYWMTGAIAERSVKRFRAEGSAPLTETAASRPLRYAFLEDSTTVAAVSQHLTGAYETVMINDFDVVYHMLKNLEVDVFFDESISEAAFDTYGDIYSEDFFPLIYNPVSLCTQNPDLVSVISVVQRALQAGAIRYLTELYNQGHQEYIRHKLLVQLTEEEHAYIRTNPVVPFVAEYDNYPLSFYNTREGQWQGIVFDVLREVEGLTGLSFQLINGQHEEWPVLLQMLEDGQASVISELIRTEEREGRFLWPDTAILSDQYALVSKSDFKNVSVNEILYVKVGLPKGTAHSVLFQEWFPNHGNTVEFDNTEDALDALERDEIDMIMTSQNQLLVLTNYRELPGYKANLVFDLSFESTFGFHLEDALLCSIVDKALSLVDTKGIAGQWTRKTYDYREKMARSRLPWLIGASVLLFCVLILLSVLFGRNRNVGKRLESLVQKRTAELNRQHALMHGVNAAALQLLESDAESYLSALEESMRIIGQSVEVDRVHLWQNSREADGRLYYTEACKWICQDLPQGGGLLKLAYDDTLVRWEDILSRGECINGPLDSLSVEEHAVLGPDMRSVLAIPVFLRGEFWGFASFDDCRRQRIFPEGEVNILRSWSLLVVGAMQRNEIEVNRRHTLNKLAAVINNYKGIIWSVNKAGVITTFNGQYAKVIGVEPADLEGKEYEVARRTNRYLRNIIDNVDTTFRQGPQDWIGDVDGQIFHSYTTPMYDGAGEIIGVVGSTDDVTELVRLQRDLESALEAAEAASRAKSVFLSNMSHEIRTPMNAIIGMTTIGKTAAGTERKDYCFEKIEAASEHLLGVINDILDMSKIEANKFELSLTEFDFEKMLQRVVNVVNHRADEKRQSLELSVDKAISQILIGDDQRLAQVIANLMSNAVKFTPENGSIRLEAQLLGEENGVYTIQISVADNGIGMSE